jgi:hypothetical protein
MFQAGSRQVPGYVPGRIKAGPGYVPGRIKAGSRICSRQDQGKVGSRLFARQDRGRFKVDSRYVLGRTKAASLQVPGWLQVYCILAIIQACSEPIPGWLEPIPGCLEPIPGCLEPIPGWLKPIPGYWTLFLAGSHAYSGTHTVPKCVHVQYCRYVPAVQQTLQYVCFP